MNGRTAPRRPDGHSATGRRQAAGHPDATPTPRPAQKDDKAELSRHPDGDPGADRPDNTNDDTDAGSPDPSTPGALIAALRGLRESISGYAGRPPEAAAILRRLDDHALPRLTHPDAPLLVVTGGPTGAGKSTVVNSMVSAPVSPSGALRPTTVTPLLVCHPGDLAWFGGPRVLADLHRVTGPAPLRGDPPGPSPMRGGTTGPAPGSGDAQRSQELPPDRLHLIAAPGLPAGLALLDAPDIDSVVFANRELSGRLTAAADLWLFVTTAARYADAVPWAALRAARSWGTPVAFVLNRVPEGAVEDVCDHLRQLMTAAGLAGAPLLVLPETTLAQPGLLPEPAAGALRDWLTGLVCVPHARTALRGASQAGGVEALIGAARRLAGTLPDTPSAARVRAATEALAGAWARVPPNGLLADDLAEAGR